MYCSGRVFYFYFVVLVILLTLCSCESLDNIASVIDQESLDEIEKVELLLLEYQFTHERELLREAYDMAGHLDEKASNNKYFEAKVLALYGHIQFFRNNQVELKTNISEIGKRNRREEEYYILRALVEPEQSNKIAILTEGKKKAFSDGKIALFLADLNFFIGHFEDAVKFYDEAFIKLHENYKNYYGKRRQLAFQFIENPPEDVKTVEVLLQDVIKIGQLIRLFYNETDLLAYLSDNPSISDRELLKRLKEEDYFARADLKLDDSDECTRAILAFFLINLIAYREDDAELITKYAPQIDYTSFSWEERTLSPVPDVRVQDYFYTAVLVLVEREIMELPDGEKFYPQKKVTGFELYEILGKVKSYF